MYCELAASGPEVGLAEGQAGNSEVGHLTIGAGRVVGTTLTRIRNGFDSGTWSRSPVWSSLRGRPRVHVAGLLSGAGVHSHYSSLIQTALLAQQAGVGQVVLHLFLDGVDSPRGSAPQWLQALHEACRAHPEIVLGSVSGRQWACDRSGSFKITAQCVDGLFGTLPYAPFSDHALAEHLKNEGESSFPVHYGAAGTAVALGEPLILTHHRADRTCQLARALNEITELYSLVELEGAVPPERVFFPIEPLHNGLVDTLAQN